MKSLKTLGLLAVAAAALMAYAGTASATELTWPTNTKYTGSLEATSTNSEWDGAFVTVKCADSRIKGAVAGQGGARASFSVSTFDFQECNYTTHVENSGTLEVDENNTVFSKGAKVAITTSVGLCVFTTNAAEGTDVGTLKEGAGAALNISSAKIPLTGGNFLCGSSAAWTGSYDLITPDTLWVD